MTINKNLYILASQEQGLSAYLKQIYAYPNLSQEEEIDLTQKIAQFQDKKAAMKLISSHMKLVIKVAHQMHGYGLSLMDLISEGSIGLIKATRKFNPELGYRFSTYAIWWIKAAIGDFIMRSWSLVKIGTTRAQNKLFFSLNKIKIKLRKLSNKSENAPLSIDETKLIANTTGVTPEEVQDMEYRLYGRDISLDEVLESNDQAPKEYEAHFNISDFIGNKTINQLDDLVDQTVSQDQIKIFREALQRLSPREQEIITARHLKDDPETFVSLSPIYKISKERVRQIEAKAFEKLKQYCLENYSQLG